MASLASGHKMHVLEGKEFDRIKDKNPKTPSCIRLTPGGWLFPEQFKLFADKIYNFEVKPTDVYIITYMKVGTTWTQEIVWTMKHNPNLDHPEGGEPILDRSPFLDLDMLLPANPPPEMLENMEPFLRKFLELCPGADPRNGVHLQTAMATPEPRVIKTHLPLSLMPPNLLDKAKVVYVVRNPMDVVCSYYHHCRLFNEMKFTGTLDEFCEYFLTDDLIYSPYGLHVKEAWEQRHHPNMHIMLYEDMKADAMKEIKKLDEFLGTRLSEKQLENVVKFTSFEDMKKRDNLVSKEVRESSVFLDHEVLKQDGGFFRKGTTGDGKKRLSPEMQKKMKDWIKKNFDFGINYL
ncbi:Sulfotransferase (sult) [Halocaridina rubra]|uniref:Sulfotransferase (Sult) n=1 Tax=Halocaridina rubra TaxID=373956 RepID=A0AAN8XKK0_HALRR